MHPHEARPVPGLWRPPEWADPIWWAGQQLTLMTAATTYLARVAEALVPAAPTAPAQPADPVAVSPPPPPPPADEAPPVAGWDELSLGSIRARLSRLSEADLVTLHAYEERHAARPGVLSMLTARLAKVRAAI